jgi:DnaJ-class molecular chaperone
MIDRKTEEVTQFELHKCIVCNGFGSLKYGTVTCHACKGRGYIVVDKLTGLPVEDRQNGKQKLG